PGRPMVMIDQVCWNEMNVNDELTLVAPVYPSPDLSPDAAWALAQTRLDEAEAYLEKLSAAGGSADKQAQVGQLKEAVEDERKKVKEEMTLRAAEAELVVKIIKETK
ncbi:MAG: hypothetical protein WCI43_04325, partial [Candidatus Firestonebacteria bacterium]